MVQTRILKPKKIKPLPPPPEKFWLSPIDPTWDELTRCWVTLENAAIEVMEDRGLAAFGGRKIEQLWAAVRDLRIARVREDRELMLAAVKRGDSSPEMRKMFHFLEECAKRIPPEAGGKGC